MSIPRVVVDTNVFLAARDPGEPGHLACRRLLEAADDGKILALVSVVTLAELRAGLASAQVAALWTPFLSHLRTSPSFSIEAVDQPVAVAAGEVRSETGLRLPDALILATALRRGADCIATEDRALLGASSPIPVRRPSGIAF